MVPSSTAQILVAIRSMKLRSWETKRIEPWKSERSSSSDSRAAMSRWLVGSSSTRKLASVSIRRAIWRRLFSPPLRVRMGLCISLYVKRRRRKMPVAACSVTGLRLRINSIGVLLRGKVSCSCA